MDEKAKLVKTLTLENHKLSLQKLQKLLELELVDIEKEEKTEAELLSELDEISHEKKIERLARLQMAFAETGKIYQYVYELLSGIHSALVNQLHIVQTLEVGAKDTASLL